MPSKVRIYPEIRIPSPLAQTWQNFRQNSMAMAGLWINLFCFVIIPVTLYLLIPMFWGENLNMVPEWAKMVSQPK